VESRSDIIRTAPRGILDVALRGMKARVFPDDLRLQDVSMQDRWPLSRRNVNVEDGLRVSDPMMAKFHVERFFRI
jgi:hypothetical protein